jgi:ribosomal protein S27AE
MRRPDDELHRKLEIRAAKAVAKVADIRRLTITPVPDGKINRVVKGLKGSHYPSKVRPVTTDDIVLKGGENISKLGGVVLVGALKGARIVTLSLEERATCPTTCQLWDACYTNSMPHLIRYKHGRQLELKIFAELAVLCKENPKVLVRLHIAGDFYSFDYLDFWRKLLEQFTNLYVFGFTAWQTDTPIGHGVEVLRNQMPDRFAVRTSNRTGWWGSFTIPFPTDRPMIAEAAVCPEQRDAMAGHPKRTHCGSCGLCWKTGGEATGRPIVFVEH